MLDERNAVVAYEQSNGTYNLHISSYLGRNLRLTDRITSESPYGTGTNGYEPGIVDETPIEESLSLQQGIDRLNFERFGAVIVVSETFDTTPYRALWFGLEDCCEVVYDSEAFGNGALVSVHGAGAGATVDKEFCTRYTATKRTLGRLVDDGVLRATEARTRLQEYVVSLKQDDYKIIFASGAAPESHERSILDTLTGSGRQFLRER
jgi:hypothetical protein